MPEKTKKCEMIGCPNDGVQNKQIAPGTNVWICQGHLEELEAEESASRAD